MYSRPNSTTLTWSYVVVQGALDKSAVQTQGVVQGESAAEASCSARTGWVQHCELAHALGVIWSRLKCLLQTDLIRWAQNQIKEDYSLLRSSAFPISPIQPHNHNKGDSESQTLRINTDMHISYFIVGLTVADGFLFLIVIFSLSFAFREQIVCMKVINKRKHGPNHIFSLCARNYPNRPAYLTFCFVTLSIYDPINSENEF